MSSTENLEQASSVSSQISKATSPAVKDFGSAISGALKSASASIGDTLNNISSFAEKLGGQGLSGKTSLTTAFDELGKLGNYSKFKDNFVPPTKVKSLTPEQTKNTPKGNYTFPSDIGDYFIQFTFVKYDRKIPIGNVVEIPTCIINLPIPQNLSEGFGMGYAEKQLGITGFLSDVISGVVKGDTGQLKDPAAFEAAGAKVRNEMFSTQGAYYAGRTLVGLSDSVGAAVDKATGVILNPFQSLIFQGVSLRSHQFSYRFSPNSAKESETLKAIIKELKIRMHPQKDGLLYLFPDVCQISFGTPGDPYFFKTCALESMSVNYAPSGQPAFFAGTNQPTEVEISMTFKEIEPLTREDFDEKFNVSTLHTPANVLGGRDRGTRGGA